MSRKTLLRKVHDRLNRHIRARHEMITVVPVKGMFNYQCHSNCVQYIMDNPDRALSLYETIIIDEWKEPNLHYVVKDDFTGEYLELTLGWRYVKMEYYLTRKIHKNDYLNIINEFDRTLTDWCEAWVPRWARWWYDITRCM